MIDWRRRIDPAFYHKEPYVLRSEAQIARYAEDAQAQVRLEVLRDDRVIRSATTVIAVAAYATATGAGTLNSRADWLTLWAFAVLAVGVARAVPWSQRSDGSATWRDALGDALFCFALIAVPAIWSHVDPAFFGLALLSGVTLFVTRGSRRLALLVIAVAVLFGSRAHPVAFGPIAAFAAAGASVLIVRAIARVWRAQPQVAMWSAFAVLVIVSAYTIAFSAAAVAPRLPFELAAIAVGYLGVCVIAGRIRRAELIARPNGVLSLPQSIVPLLDRSHDHAIICWND
jgi:hypothetical protein